MSGEATKTKSRLGLAPESMNGEGIAMSEKLNMNLISEVDIKTNRGLSSPKVIIVGE